MFKILSLDGGGIKGVFTAAALARIEALAQKRLVDYFDLICGTSTGGIIAIGLALGISAEQILRFYRERGPVIFSITGPVERSYRSIFQIFVGPKFSRQMLREELNGILRHAKLGDSRCRLAIPSYDAVAGRIYVFKTAHNPRFQNDINMLAVDVALATSAAPTYFSAAPSHQYGKFVDGGIWANNPALVGVIEAVSVLGIPLDQIHLLSVGTTTQPFSITNNTNAGALRWNLGLLNLLFEAQVQTVTSEVGLLLGKRFHRINFQATPGRFSLDNASSLAIDDLTNLGFSEAQKKDHIDAVFADFLSEKAAPFVPIFGPATDGIARAE